MPGSKHGEEGQGQMWTLKDKKGKCEDDEQAVLGHRGSVWKPEEANLMCL